MKVGQKVLLGKDFYCGSVSLKGVKGDVIEQKKKKYIVEFINPVYNEIDECEGEDDEFQIIYEKE